MTMRTPDTEPATPTRPTATRSERIRALTRTEIRIARRDGEQLLLTLGLPVLFLTLFSLVDLLPTGSGPAVDFLTPGIFTLAVISVSFVRLTIGLGFDRSFGAIRRFGLTPLSPAEFIAAKGLATAALLAVQLGVLTGVALALGWSPGAHFLVIAVIVAGLVTFSALGIVVSGRIEGLTALAVANTVYVVLLVLSGLIFDLDRLARPLAAGARALPSTAMAELLRSGLAATPSAGPGWAWIVLLSWTVVTPLVAVRLFRWE